MGLPPNRIDLLRLIEGPEFAEAWKGRVKGEYGRAAVNPGLPGDLDEREEQIEQFAHMIVLLSVVATSLLVPMQRLPRLNRFHAAVLRPFSPAGGVSGELPSSTVAPAP